MTQPTTLIETQEGKVLLNEAAYSLIREKAPQELPLYVDARDLYLANPEDYGRIQEGEDEVLGIGEVVAVKTLTKMIFPVIAPILQYLVKVVTETFQEELGEEAVDWVRSLFSQEKSPQPIFDQSDLDAIAATIESIAKTEADLLGLEPNEVYIISNAIIARLALAKK